MIIRYSIKCLQSDLLSFWLLIHLLIGRWLPLFWCYPHDVKMRYFLWCIKHFSRFQLSVQIRCNGIFEHRRSAFLRAYSTRESSPFPNNFFKHRILPIKWYFPHFSKELVYIYHIYVPTTIYYIAKSVIDLIKNIFLQQNL